MIFAIPLPQMLNTTITARATSARTQFVEQLPTADGARPKPIAMMIGPVTTGGKNLITLSIPTALIIAARTKYKRPAHATPRHAYGSIDSGFSGLKAFIAAYPPKNANDEPKNAGTLNFVRT